MRTDVVFSFETTLVRTRRLFTTSTESFPTVDIRDFGFGIFRSSSVPVLKFEVGPKWNVIAWQVSESDVRELLAAAAESGLHVFSRRIWLKGTPA